MSPLEFADFQGSARGRLASENDQPARQSVLKPFCWKLNVDEKLGLSNENFKHLIDKLLQQKQNAPKPTHMKARFFHTPCAGPVCLQDIHRLKKRRDWRSVWETDSFTWRLEVTDDSVEEYKEKGYSWAAYWHTERQQVVMARWGTKITNLGALWTDLNGVEFKN